MRIIWLVMIIVQTGLSQSSSFSREMLEAHNRVRARVKVPPMVWSTKLASFAQQWANKLLTGRRLEHRRNIPYGENLYLVSGQRISAREVVDDWSSEPLKDLNHHTQIVWRDTKEVGCAVARNARREVYVCNYNPPGNIVGQRPY